MEADLSTSDIGYRSKAAGYFAAVRREMLPFVPEEAVSVLDVGCGDGSFGALLKQTRNCRVTGIEHVAAVARIAESRLDNVVIGSLEDDMPLSPGQFDCVVCNDVLEHLIDPWGAVRRLADLLKPGGTIVASIPNVRHYKVLKALIQDKTWEYTDKGVLDRTHLRFFTRSTMAALFESAGLVVEIIQGINGTRRYPPKYALLNWLTFGGLEDARYLQFACVSRKAAV